MNTDGPDVPATTQTLVERIVRFSTPGRRPAKKDAQCAPHELYDQVAEAAADVVIKRYSTSFGVASKLLGGCVRTHVRNIYALVRVADEIVDAPRPDQRSGDQAAMLADLHAEVIRSLETGHSTNLVVHAFARTAQTCGIGADLIDPFFVSMEMDLHRTEHDRDSFEAYIYGSAEVIGLMCLKAFLLETDDPEGQYARLAPGARRLGAAFQKVNFLRDLAADHDGLGRSYFPDLDVRTFGVAERDRLLDDIDADLAAADVALAQLPASSRRAVKAAHALFAELAACLRRTTPDSIRARRVRVPTARKAQLVALALAGGNA